VAEEIDRDRAAPFTSALQAQAAASVPQTATLEGAEAQGASLVVDFEGIRIDTRDWPLLTMEMPEGPVNDDAVREALAHLERIMAQTPARTRFFQVTDLSRMKRFAPASQRRYAAEWTRRTAELALRVRLGGIVVAPSPMLRAILTAMFWSQGAKPPLHVVSSRAEGILRGIHALEAAHPPLSPHLVALRERINASGAPHLSSGAPPTFLPAGSLTRK
jgi:hypothetical protein